MEYFLKQFCILKKKKSWSSFSLPMHAECKYSSAKKPLILSGFSQRSSYGLIGLTTVHLKRGIWGNMCDKYSYSSRPEKDKEYDKCPLMLGKTLFYYSYS